MKGGWKGKKTKPSKGLSRAEVVATVKAARAGKDIGKPGKHFEGIARKAASRYGSEEAGRRVAAAAMWKHKAQGR